MCMYYVHSSLAKEGPWVVHFTLGSDGGGGATFVTSALQLYVKDRRTFIHGPSFVRLRYYRYCECIETLLLIKRTRVRSILCSFQLTNNA